MSEAVAHLSPDRALRLIAQHGGKGKTAAVLRQEAEDFEREALRCSRITIGGSTRRKARQLSRARKAEEHRNNAKLVTIAAAELDRRCAKTVRDALRNPVSRFLRRLVRRG